jgi:hypothetical protein
MLNYGSDEVRVRRLDVKHSSRHNIAEIVSIHSLSRHIKTTVKVTSKKDIAFQFK